MTAFHTRQLSGLSNALLCASAENQNRAQKILPPARPPARTPVPSKREHAVKATIGSGKDNNNSSTSDSCRIRSKLLNRLGIEKDDHHAAALAVGGTTGAARLIEPSSAVLRGQHDAFDAVLKADYGEPDEGLERQKEKQGSINDNNNNKKGEQQAVVIATSPGDEKMLLLLSHQHQHPQDAAEQQEPPPQLADASSHGVVFDATVKVHPIPARSDYSARMQAALWTPQEEIQQNAARNQFEFAAEEWDYTKVVDDRDMVLYGGERVHPIHFLQEAELKEFFRNILAQQKKQQQQQQQQQQADA